ncbi:serine/threonine-protein kinase haspin-like [Hemicordylus capensis]|uniref:serine/threonine-protein kinase haspin-like n=1 Tax=Hemicordylus capensis TaxID=884348 RepID=UPI00230426FD|nr:serine/threonine-protein kinase haspin-like [Hemicordylus capensis]
METHRPRLLRTYAGPREQGGPRLRLLPPSAPWISPQADPRRLFSTSSSSGAASSLSRDDDDDSDFQPPKRLTRARRQQKRQQQPRRKCKKGGKENQAPHVGGSSSSSPPRACLAAPTLLWKNITRRPHQKKRGKPPPLIKARLGRGSTSPLLCSTPEPPLLTPVAKEGLLQEGERPLQGSGPVSDSVLCVCCSPREVLWESSHATPNALSELSLLKMDGVPVAQEMGGSFELFSKEGPTGLQLKSPREVPRTQPPPSPVSQTYLSWSPCSPIALQPPNIWGKSEASTGNRKGLNISPENLASPTPNQLACHPLQAADKDDDQELPVSPKTGMTPSSPSQGALQLQARICNDKIALFLPRDATPLPSKRQRTSAQMAASPEKAAGDLNGELSEEGSDFSIDHSSPQLQPIVVLDNQVVPNWLASQSTRKQATGHSSQKKGYNLQSGSSCVLPEVSGTRSKSQVVPTCNPGGTIKKACISGFSCSRWRPQGRAKHKKKAEWKEQADPSFLQQCLKWNEKEEDLPLSLLSPDCSLLKNSSWWRRIRASFSLHKKKKILTEVESFNANTSVKSSVSEAPKTPFTQKLGYSICPSSSMVLLSSMTSFSTPEVTLTDAEKVYRECQQEGPISFEECIPPDKMQKCQKVGEGVFGEVFRTEGERGAVALKIIPIEGSVRVNGEAQKTFSEILPEIIISKELSLLADEEANQTTGFISLYSAYCIQGSYPEHLLKAWDEYHRLSESENDRPDFFGDQQLFMVLEFEFGGSNLENMRNRQLSSMAAARSILHQLTASLAVAEKALHFEHRDLHWGNVLVKKTNLKELSFTLSGETHTFPTHGILVNIIDYTFSRLEKDGLTVYCDLSTDEEVFQGRGDYQFDIYRKMREENENNWADYFPHSNVLWLHYLADKLLKEVSYKNKVTTASMRQVQQQLQLFSKEVLGYRTATDLLNSSTFFH